MRTSHNWKQLFIVSLLVIAGLLPYFLSVERTAPARKSMNLANIPKQIGPWHMTTEKMEPSSFEKNFLNDVLFRSYERPDGKIVALAIAYGADQRQNFSIHVPEGCYRASGYDVTSLGVTTLSAPNIPLKQLVAHKDKAAESIQYWIVLNGNVVTNHFERKLKQLYYSLLGARAGGTLVRVSSATTTESGSSGFDVQKDFIVELYRALNQNDQSLLFGTQSLAANR